MVDITYIPGLAAITSVNQLDKVRNALLVSVKDGIEKAPITIQETADEEVGAGGTTFIADISEKKGKLIFFKNTQDVDVAFEVYGSMDDAGLDAALLVGFTILTGGDNVFETLFDPWPYLVVIATAAGVPTSGTVFIEIAEQK